MQAILKILTLILKSSVIVVAILVSLLVAYVLLGTLYDLLRGYK